MNAAEIEAALEVAAPRSGRARGGLPCRGLLSEPFSPASLRRDLADVPLPPRTVALLTGNGDGYGTVEGVVVRWAHARVRSLVGRLEAGEALVASYRLDVAGLTGLGPGLTPTGDDLLVGLAAEASRMSAVGLVEPRASAAYLEALSDLPLGETTPVARGLLVNASKGLYPSVLAAVVEALGNPGTEHASLELETGLLTATGAHSGADLLAGAVSLAWALAFPEETA